MELSTKRLTPPPLGKKKPKKAKKDLLAIKQILCDGSSDTCQMASLERFKGLTHRSDQDQSWEGSPHPKIEKKKCVLNDPKATSIVLIPCF